MDGQRKTPTGSMSGGGYGLSDVELVK